MFSASVGEQIIASPRRLSEVFRDTPLPVEHFEFFHHVVVARVVFALEHLGAGRAVLMDHFRHAGFHSSDTSKVKVMNGAG